MKRARLNKDWEGYMKFSILIIMVMLAILCGADSARASYLVIPGNRAIKYSGGCTFSSEGWIIGSESCRLIYPINIESGKTLSSITLYYYDAVSPQHMSAILKRLSLSTTAGVSSLVSTSDISTSSSVQFTTMTYDSTISSSYAYTIFIELSSGTILRGIKLYYY